MVTHKISTGAVVRRVLLSGAALGALATPALAQRDEIVVTAQLREQSLQDVPIAVQVIDDQQIQDLAADNIADIAAFIPGLSVSAGSPTQPKYSIRGIQTSDFGVGTDPAVGVYIDGVYSGRTGAAVLEFDDIERIEILKGPQGTLFGRNAAAGAVSIVTKKPSDEFEASLYARGGNYGKQRLEALVNMPLGDSFAVRVNALANYRHGLFKDAASGEDLSRERNWAARAQAMWTPGDATEVIASWTHDNLNQDARPALGVIAIPAFPATPAPGPSPSAYINPFTAPLLNDAVDNHETRNLDEYTLRIQHNLGDVLFNSISSYRAFKTENREDEDGTNRIDLYFDTNNRENNNSFYQELRLSGAGDTLDWLVGASFFDENAEQVSDTFAFTDSINTTLGNVGFGTPFTDNEAVLQFFGVPATLLGHPWREAIFNRGDYKAYAAYGDVIWHATDRLNLTFGLRYTKDKKSFSWLNGPREAPELDANLAIADAALGAGCALFGGFQFDVIFDMNGFSTIACDNGVTVAEGVKCILHDSFSDISPRAVVDYRLTDNMMVFFNYAQGYKAGGFNSVQPGSRFTNEDVNNYEAGFKSSYPDAGLTLNLSGFRYVYNNKQAIFLDTSLTIPQYVTQTSDEEAWGADFAAQWTPNEGPATFFASAQYIDATYKSRISNSGQDLSGEPTGTPKWNLAFGARISKEIDLGGRVEFQIAHAYASKCRPNSESLAQGTCTGGLGAFSPANFDRT
ncbi:MAG: TonB-dependent receptor, partial [Pseudomonadota bacterium]